MSLKLSKKTAAIPWLHLIRDSFSGVRKIQQCTKVLVKYEKFSQVCIHASILADNDCDSSGLRRLKRRSGVGVNLLALNGVSLFVTKSNLFCVFANIEKNAAIPWLHLIRDSASGVRKTQQCMKVLVKYEKFSQVRQFLILWTVFF